MRVRPGFLLGLLTVFAFLGWLISGGIATEKDKAKAKFIQTLSEERLMAALLEEQRSRLVA